MILGPPRAPRTRSGRAPGGWLSTMVGHIEESGRFPPATAFASPPTSFHWFATPFASEKSSIWLLSRTPVPGATIAAPYQEFNVVVSAIAPPRSSAIERLSVFPEVSAGSDPGGTLLEGVARSSRIVAPRAAR